MPSIVVNGLGFEYGRNVVLKDINIHLDSPGLYCIIGPNGVGKSTLVKCIDGLLKPTSGNILIDGKDVSEYTVKELSRKVSFVPASVFTAFPMSVVDSILLGRDTEFGKGHDFDDIAIAYRSIRVMNMEELSLRNCNELSAGQLQKTTLCRGLVTETDIMILDEPTSNLDIRHQVFICDFLHRLATRSGKLILMISHDLNLAARFADTVIVMSEPGIIYDSGLPQDVVNERMLSEVYHVRSEVIERKGRPHVILDSAENW